MENSIMGNYSFKKNGYKTIVKIVSIVFLIGFVLFGSSLTASAETPWNWPVLGHYTITQDYNWNGSCCHHGIDINDSSINGTPIVAVDSGTVEYAGAASGYGQWIVIRHSNGYRSIYGHMYQSGVYVKPGQTVYRGQTIGAVGSNGESTAPHLHFSVATNANDKSTYKDPKPFLHKQALRVQINGQDMVYPGISENNKTHIHWGILNTLKIPYTYKGNGLFSINGRDVQGIVVSGHTFLPWDFIVPGKLTPYQIPAGWNFVYSGW